MSESAAFAYWKAAGCKSNYKKCLTAQVQL